MLRFSIRLFSLLIISTSRKLLHIAGSENTLTETENKYVFHTIGVFTISLNFVCRLASIILQLARNFRSIASFTPPQPNIPLTYSRMANDKKSEVPVPRYFFDMICALRQQTFLRLYSLCQQCIPSGIGELWYLS